MAHLTAPVGQSGSWVPGRARFVCQDCAIRTSYSIPPDLCFLTFGEWEIMAPTSQSLCENEDFEPTGRIGRAQRAVGMLEAAVIDITHKHLMCCACPELSEGFVWGINKSFLGSLPATSSF